MPSVGIIGAGLAGSEAALVLARRNIAVTLYEMRPLTTTPAHATGLPAELVCSNSLKSRELPGAQALLKEELALLKSPLLGCANKTSVPAGKALAVDRKAFSEAVFQELRGRPSLTLKTCELSRPPDSHDCVIIATGPLSSNAIVEWLSHTFSSQSLYFYDAIAPIVSKESIDFEKAFLGSRWHPEENDYCNCPFDEQEFMAFYEALIGAETVKTHAFEEEKFFEACLPLEIIAKRGKLSMAYGPLKPIGFIDPRTGKRPFALCQLRRENVSGESFSLVACQTRLTRPEQTRVFRMVPGLKQAEFLRFGTCHRNTYLDSPSILGQDLSFKAIPSLFCAGQLCGNEGYVESITTGHIAALAVAAKIAQKGFESLPETTAAGSLIRHVSQSTVRPFTPSSFHYGLLPGLKIVSSRKIPKHDKQKLMCDRALEDMKDWMTRAQIV
jgi:methylenetetrahydrofolate--tRNA-(uracil-5-)-methyltransferase